MARGYFRTDKSNSPFCWSTNLFEQDFIEFRTVEQTALAIKFMG